MFDHFYISVFPFSLFLPCLVSPLLSPRPQFISQSPACSSLPGEATSKRGSIHNVYKLQHQKQILHTVGFFEQTAAAEEKCSTVNWSSVKYTVCILSVRVQDRRVWWRIKRTRFHFSKYIWSNTHTDKVQVIYFSWFFNRFLCVLVNKYM